MDIIKKTYSDNLLKFNIENFGKESNKIIQNIFENKFISVINDQIVPLFEAQLNSNISKYLTMGWPDLYDYSKLEEDVRLNIGIRSGKKSFKASNLDLDNGEKIFTSIIYPSNNFIAVTNYAKLIIYRKTNTNGNANYIRFNFWLPMDYIVLIKNLLEMFESQNKESGIKYEFKFNQVKKTLKSIIGSAKDQIQIRNLSLLYIKQTQISLEEKEKIKGDRLELDKQFELLSKEKSMLDSDKIQLNKQLSDFKKEKMDYCKQLESMRKIIDNMEEERIKLCAQIQDLRNNKLELYEKLLMLQCSDRSDKQYDYPNQSKYIEFDHSNQTRNNQYDHPNQTRNNQYDHPNQTTNIQNESDDTLIYEDMHNY